MKNICVTSNYFSAKHPMIMMCGTHLEIKLPNGVFTVGNILILPSDVGIKGLKNDPK